jgi:hypothetical protein
MAVGASLSWARVIDDLEGVFRELIIRGAPRNEPTRAPVAQPESDHAPS